MMPRRPGVALKGAKCNAAWQRSGPRWGVIPWHIVFAVLALCSSAQAADPPELRKPAPDAMLQPSRERLAALVRARYPQLLSARLTAIPVVTMLFNPDGSVARSNLQILAQTSGTLTAAETRFADFGVRSGELQYLGETPVQLPNATVLVVFGARSDEVLDRELVERYFPQVLTSGIPGGQTLWILFDHDGHVRKYGAERIQSADLRKMMKIRYPGIHIADASIEPIMSRSGRPLEDLQHEAVHLSCLWLAADSALPAG
jgi:hypothetical protein